MKIVIKIKSLPETLALVALGMFLIASILDVTFYVQYIPRVFYKAVVAIALFLLLIKESFKGKYEYKTLIGLITTILIYFIIGRVSSVSSNIAVSLFFIYALRDIPFKNVAKTSLIISVFLLSIVIIGAKTGVILNYLEFSGARVRNYLGFRYALFRSI